MAKCLSDRIKEIAALSGDLQARVSEGEADAEGTRLGLFEVAAMLSDLTDALLEVAGIVSDISAAAAAAEAETEVAAETETDTEADAETEVDDGEEVTDNG